MLAWIFFATLILVCFGIMFLNGDMEYIRNMNNIELYDVQHYEKVEIIRNINPFDENNHDVFIKYHYANPEGNELKKYFASHHFTWKSLDANEINEEIVWLEKFQNIKSGYYYSADYYKEKDEFYDSKKKHSIIEKTTGIYDNDTNTLYYISYAL